MLGVLIRKEILNNLLNLRFSLTYFLCAFLLVGSAAVTIADYCYKKRVYDLDQARFAESIHGGPVFEYYVRYPKNVVRAPVLLSFLSSGGERDPDMYGGFRIGTLPTFGSDSKRNPIINLFPSFDMTFVIGVIISLLIFILTYDAISGEREEGTLKIMLSGPLPRDTIIIAKYLGGFISLIVPIIASWLTIIIMLLLTQGFSITAVDWVRMLLIMIVCCLYTGVIFAVSLMISAVARSSSTSIIALLLVWVCVIVVIPSSAAPVAHLLLRHRSANQIDIDGKMAGILYSKNEGGMFDAYIKERFHVDTGNAAEYSRLRNEEEPNFTKWRWHRMGDSMALLVERNAAGDDRVENFARWITRLSPYGLLQNICTSIANTGYEHDREVRLSLAAFAKKVSAFVDQPQLWFDKPFDPQSSPDYTYRLAGPVQSVGNSLLDIFILCAFGMIFFMIAFLKFITMDVV
jgi:ABC-type transport system involved in multi-copper enzyme maturation permease subunit